MRECIQEDAYPAEKRGGSKVGDSPTVQGYVEEKIEYIYCPENPRIKSQKWNILVNLLG